jgi:hypothetical protein
VLTPEQPVYNIKFVIQTQSITTEVLLSASSFNSEEIILTVLDIA